MRLKNAAIVQKIYIFWKIDTQRAENAHNLQMITVSLNFFSETRTP